MENDLENFANFLWRARQHLEEAAVLERLILHLVLQWRAMLYHCSYWHQAKTAKERLSKADLSLLAPHI